MRDIRQVAAGSVDNALGLAGGAGGIKDEEDVLGIHLLGRAVAADVVLGHDVVPPAVATFDHLHVVPGALDDDGLFDGGTAAQGVVGIGLERNGLARADDRVGSDQHLGFAVLNARLERKGGESGKDHGVHGPDAGAGKHGNGQFRHHGQVQGHAVALFDAHFLQCVGKLADLGVQHLVGVDLHFLIRLPLPDDGGLVPAAVFQMLVQAVVGDIQLAALEPVDLRLVEIVIKNGVPRLEPVHQLFRTLCPKAFRVFISTFGERLKLVHAANVGIVVLGRLEELALFHHTFNLAFFAHTVSSSLAVMKSWPAGRTAIPLCSTPEGVMVSIYLYELFSNSRSILGERFKSGR